ncbi:ANM_HP_G0029650.mRNA.1.CDS.1 [Saccharomyces cerevisiae]|nr:ANM_HP_G0204420.mRNA.1.CDS.1 [Saccharomyces cerevisiae]CAI5172836.1 ANM_HP_G0239550.mRNA.1.CDS.1 [Saccharomyces cerevisiae]CAI5218747.1 ANM_HP_G0029650.mRNA.1.CDS.1 [Saccharomyces cerevisiae]CAI6698704.1 ANM_collapsed_G0022980.mRNA.1.CDS.1 [Saccharomyces cerevisiae]CAI6964235.1 ANM_HP_G0204420.mRNA.1.CDS.1 [Saccharomyces cerevisiae]
MMSTIYRHLSTARPALTKYATNAAVKSTTASSEASTLGALQYALSLDEPSDSWTKSQLKEIYHTPLLELTHAAQLQHRKWHDPTKVQLCTLMNIKSGGCSEDCKYCAQSSRNDTGLKAEKMVKVDEVIKEAEEAKRNGSTRFCLGAAWRDMKGRKSAMKRIQEMVTKVNDMGLETCVTLGMVDQDQAKQLKDAGLTAYNHNIDTSREHYSKVITTRTYDDRLQTIKNVQESGIKACTGGILGLGESEDDHIGFIYTLSNMSPHPESLPINRLVAIKGTPMAEELADPKSKKLQFDEILRTIATARIVMPKAIIRLAAGRYTMKETEQFVCFMAGCNSIFTGKKMLTTMCNDWDEDKAMLAKWGLQPMEAFKYDRS